MIPLSVEWNMNRDPLQKMEYSLWSLLLCGVSHPKYISHPNYIDMYLYIYIYDYMYILDMSSPTPFSFQNQKVTQISREKVAKTTSNPCKAAGATDLRPIKVSPNISNGTYNGGILTYISCM